MRILLTLLLTSFCALAQTGLRSPAYVANLHPLAAAAGGGSGVVGPPVVYMVRTNGTTTPVSAGTAITNIVETSTDANRLIVYAIDWFPASVQLTNVSFNGVTNGVLLLSSNSWDGPCVIYYLTNPPIGPTYYTTALKFNASVDEVNFYTVVLTNAAQTSTFNIVTNSAISGNTGLTNATVSATNELVIGYSAKGDAPETATWIAGWTKIGERSTGAGEHTSAFATQLGIAGSNTNGISWITSANTRCLTGVSIRGINTP